MEFLVAIAGGAIGYIYANIKFRFETLHQKRLVVIEEMYRVLQVADTEYHKSAALVRDYIGRDEKDELYRNILEKSESMRVYVETKKIFLTPQEQNLIENITKKYFKIFESLHVAKTIGLGKEQAELLIENWKSLNQELPEIRKILEAEFRKSLFPGLKFWKY